MSFCENRLGKTISRNAVGRAHGVGRYTDSKRRPIVVRFLSFKTKVQVLRLASRPKGTGFAIGKDYSWKVQQQRKCLPNFLGRLRGLDSLFCSVDNAISNVSTMHGISDRNFVLADVNCDARTTAETESRVIYFYERGNYDAISTSLGSYFPSFVAHKYAL